LTSERKRPTGRTTTTKLNPSSLNPFSTSFANLLVHTSRLARCSHMNSLVHPSRLARCIRDASAMHLRYHPRRYLHNFTRGSLTCFGYLRWNSFTKVSTASSPSRCSQGSHDASSGGYPCQNTEYSTRFALRLSRLFAIDSTTQNFSPSMTSGGEGPCRRPGIFEVQYG
jgi:hypothetical protein